MADMDQFSVPSPAVTFALDDQNNIVVPDIIAFCDELLALEQKSKDETWDTDRFYKELGNLVESKFVVRPSQWQLECLWPLFFKAVQKKRQTLRDVLGLAPTSPPSTASTPSA